MSIEIATFYKFVALPDYEMLRPALLTLCTENEIAGSILLAAEGINATIAGTPENMATVLGSLQDDLRFAEMVVKRSYAAKTPFRRMKVRLKKEIVTLKQPVDPTERVGEYVAPAEWNALIRDPDVLLIDTRNDFEVEIGSFEGAVNPETESFSEFAEYVAQNLDPSRDKK